MFFEFQLVIFEKNFSLHFINFNDIEIVLMKKHVTYVLFFTDSKLLSIIFLHHYLHVILAKTVYIAYCNLVGNTGKTPKAFPSLTIDEINHIQDTLPYVNIHMNEILNEAFITMFTLNPDIQDKFFKDYIATAADSDEFKGEEDQRKSILMI